MFEPAMTRLFGDAYESVRDPYLRRAIDLALLGRGTTAPNPVVGCVLVREGEIVGEGWHERAGGPHAEAAALTAAGERALGATAYVTLEPCSHTGRTAPCADALARAGVARVVIGMTDPNPEASGGADLLRRSGIGVEFASDPSPFVALNEEWLHRLRTGHPFVRVKVALSLDGRPTLTKGFRSSMTGQSARAFSMRLRSESDAILVGTGTVAVDDPSLTVRDAEGALAPRQPRRYVLTRTEQPAKDARMFHDGAGAVGVLVPDALELDAALREAGARAVAWDAACGLSDAFRALADDDVVSLLVETGPRLFSSLVAASLIDELVVIHAGGLAGEEAPPLYVGESQEDVSTLDREFRAVEAGVVGSDAVTVWRPRRAQAE
jgi:diaminohydroxyphosphoribosylaminopyrimidine deaminase / 5-amino-6-(5-phosphoribosylamino)uracil reductase